MWCSVILLSISAGVAFGFSTPNAGSRCPPEDQVAPCTCSERGPTAVCKGISNADIIKGVFNKNPYWKLLEVVLDNCVMQYIPSLIFKTASFQGLLIASSTFISLFDATLPRTPELNLYMKAVKIKRGMQWEFFSNTTLNFLGVVNVEIKHFDKKFKDHMPETLTFIWLQKTKTLSITDQAFERMVNVESFSLIGGSIKKISRDMFPRPWNVADFSLSKQKIAALPEDIISDMPRLRMFVVEDNYLTTISEHTFTKEDMSYFLERNPIICNCRIKWITKYNRKKPYFDGSCAEPQSWKGRNLEDLTEDDFDYCQGNWKYFHSRVPS